MKKMKAKDLLILGGASAIAMAAGIVVGWMKEKMKTECCIVDEMKDL